MDYRDSTGEAAFRASFREWLELNRPADPLPLDPDLRDAFTTDWHRRLFDAGWIGLTLPVEFGGAGKEANFDMIFNEELASSGSPPIHPVVHLARAVLAFGSTEQKRRWVRKILSCEERWCQGFSEPDAGSDLASLRARAERDEAGWTISGQKVWTSHAVRSQYCIVLARTDSDLPKHKGISAFVVPLGAPGVTVRPLVQCTGDDEFAEVFLEDVRVDADAMLGEPGAGWALAMTTINYERGPADVGHLARYEKQIKDLLELGDGSGSPTSGRRDDDLMAVYVAVDVLRMHVRRSLSERIKSGPGPAGSVDKLLMAEVEQALGRLADDMLGTRMWTGLDPEWLRTYLYSRGSSIMGGTDEIQRTVIAQRLLGLPR